MLIYNSHYFMLGVALTVLFFCDVNNLCYIHKGNFYWIHSHLSVKLSNTSWLEHYSTTASGKSTRSNCPLFMKLTVCLDHFPICIEIVCDINILQNMTMTMTMTMFMAFKNMSKFAFSQN